MTIEEALAQAAARLQGTSDSPRLDAEVLLCHTLGVSRAHLYTWPTQQLDAAMEQRLQTLIEQRVRGVPVAYLTGRQEFWSLPLEVSEATLIPRPETELLVERALDLLPAALPCTVLDLGTGSGAIALALASERRQAKICAVDASAAALQVASRNSRRLGLVIELLQGDWYAPVAGRRFHMIVSNPPYIGADEPEVSQGDCRFEPRQALVAGDTGLAALQRIIQGAPEHLEPGGWLLVEHGYRQGAACRTLFHESGFSAVETVPDLQGHERITLGQNER